VTAKETDMNPEQVAMIQASFAKVVPIADQAAVIFYDRLFDIAPQVKPMFKGDMAEQRRKLMAMLATVVNGLGNLPSVLPAASMLAKRHTGYGVERDHYPVVGAALLWTLERGLRAEWTPELAAAWSGAYATLSDFMIAEAYGHAEAAE
jgi:hemoglobin-like flavoprotein